MNEIYIYMNIYRSDLSEIVNSIDFISERRIEDVEFDQIKQRSTTTSVSSVSIVYRENVQCIM